MRIVHDIRTVVIDGPTVLSIGNFDGLHRGHRMLLAATRLAADTYGSGAQAGLLTFSPHPFAVLRPGFPHQILTTPAERMALAAAEQIDFGIIQPFDTELAGLSAQQFLLLLKERLGLVELVVGPDFALGHNREGNQDALRTLGEELGFSLTVIEPMTWQGKAVRSSIIRQALREGRVDEAADLLGRPYAITGVVHLGDQRGRLLGIPTANLAPEPELLLPADGVYATRAAVLTGPATGSYASVTNIGVRPTVDGLHHRVETHLLAYAPPPERHDEIYGADIRLEFAARLRGERRFHSIDALIGQIHADIAAATTLLAPTG